MSIVLHSFAFCLLLACAVPDLCYAQTSARELSSAPAKVGWGEQFSWGVFGNANFNIHRADFRALPGVPSCCPQFESGSGIAFSAGVLGDIPLSSQLALQLRLGYYSHNALLLASEHEPVVVNGHAVDGVFEHTVDANIASVAVEPLVRLRATEVLSVFVGGRIGVVLAPSYEQREVISEPAAGVFTDTKTRERNVFSGDLPDAASVEAAITGGIGYTLPLNSKGSLYLVPEVLYSFGLTDVVKDVSWSMTSLRAGVSVVYVQQPPPEILPVPTPPTTPVPVVPVQPVEKPLSVQISAQGIDTLGEAMSAAIRIEEFEATEMYPLLNYVFFDENSAVIPSRYRALSADEQSSFHIVDAQSGGALQVYYHLLNILGQRMREYPAAMLTLTGCNTATGTEQNNTALSRSRAEAVKNYLVSTWGIEPARLAVEARNLPARPSSQAEEDGKAENRRVEITTSEAAVLAPVVLPDTVIIIKMNAIRLLPQILASGEGVRQWEIGVVQGRDSLQQWSGSGNPGASYDWDVAAFARRLQPKPVDYFLRASDGEKHAMSKGNPIPVERITIEQKRKQGISDKKFAIYRLILFDFDRADISGTNSSIIDFVRQRTQPDATVRYTGSTDRLGDAEHNRQLSADRARAAARALGLQGEVLGAGEDSPPYDNALPEGRFYSRTVTIHVNNPVR